MEEETPWRLEAYIGLYDDPENQAQNPVLVDFAQDGHLAVCGTVVCGKSTFLQTLLYSLMNRYDPGHLNIYALDFSSHMLSAFEHSSHVGGILYESDTDKIGKLFCMLERMLDERKKLFQGGNYSQYVQVHGIVVPAVILVIDNYASFREKTDNEYEDILIHISRDGSGYGIYLVIASGGFGSSEIQSRIGDNIRTVICLEMGDKFKYADAMRTMHFDVLPESGIKGRGLVNIGGNILEFQTALALEAVDDYKRVEGIQSQCTRLNEAWTKLPARRIPEIPEHPNLCDFMELPEYQQAVREKNSLPVGYNTEDASCYQIELRSIYCYLLSGRARTGKSNALKVMIHTARAIGAKICIIDDSSGKFRKVAEETEARYLSNDQEVFDYLTELTPVFVERNKQKHVYMEEGMNDYEIYEKMSSFCPVIICISNLLSFMKSIYTPEKGVGGMSGFVENILEKGILHNIYLLGCFNTDDYTDLSQYRAFHTFTGYKKGMHFGGNIAGQRVFSFNNIPYIEQSKTMKAGEGLTPSEEDENIAVKVMLPLARG